jgi:hypothetical protein
MNRRWLIGGKEIMEKSIWHNLGKDWRADVSSLIPILEAAKKGQAIGIGLANLGCRFKGMSPLLATISCGHGLLCRKCCTVLSCGHLIEKNYQNWKRYRIYF